MSRIIGGLKNDPRKTYAWYETPTQKLNGRGEIEGLYDMYAEKTMMWHVVHFSRFEIKAKAKRLLNMNIPIWINSLTIHQV